MGTLYIDIKKGVNKLKTIMVILSKNLNVL